GGQPSVDQPRPARGAQGPTEFAGPAAKRVSAANILARRDQRAVRFPAGTRAHEISAIGAGHDIEHASTIRRKAWALAHIEKELPTGGFRKSGEARARVPRRRTGSGWSKSAPPGTGAFPG